MAKCLNPSLDTAVSALSDATRRGILERLSRGEASVSELAEPFGVSLPTIHKHLRVLERAGFIGHEKRGRVRHVRLNPRAARNCPGSKRIHFSPMRAVTDWIAQLESHWGECLQRLKEQVEADL
jgi:DNA-binding transcriptional ArsR family regulator